MTVPRRSRCSLLLNTAVELPLLLCRLEPTVPELRRGVDELERDLLKRAARRLRHKRLAQRDQSLLHADHRTLDHHIVLIDLTIVRETTERGDSLLREIVVRHRVVRVLLQVLADLVDLLVDLRAVMVTELTAARRLEFDAGRMPVPATLINQY